jgi:hypothetical protein
VPPRLSAASRPVPFRTRFGAVLRFGLHLTLACCPVALTAQHVRGRLLEDGRRDAIPLATVRLLDRSSEAVVASVLSDSVGTFHLRASTPGLYRVEASALGYRNATSQPLELLTGDTLDVEFLLSVDAVLLAPLKVTATRLPPKRSLSLDISQFYDRQRIYGATGLGAGTFFERSDIERLKPGRITDLVRRAPSVRVEGGGGSSTRLTMRRGCTPKIYLDGVLVRMPGEINDLVSVSDLNGVEIYSGTAVPGEFMDLQSLRPCGAIAFWTGP